MYYLIDVTNGKDALVEGGQIQRPPWLGFSVHVFNSMVAWADILCSHPRSFSNTSGRLSVGIVTFYTCWILLCSHFNGAFPYPILNELPWPTVSFCVSLLCADAFTHNIVHILAVMYKPVVTLLQGFFGLATTSIIMFYLIFLSGRQMCKRLLLKRTKVD